ncbi:hypothetical protein D6810_01770 [Candidatus Dojkabacteria bacterium]|uniref:Uncharacterized protein n=1 Tax=Candidatus Dojkabacteria bacterium TaxID=2099670 RepID=A0A3M0Z0J7_9BACT|nr:MAG: hypothetical protein D6810_01770 [Candidatus Dojkabacteria bacterium]
MSKNKFVSDFKIVNNQENKYFSIFGNQITLETVSSDLSGNVIEMIILAEIAADRKKEDLSKFNKFICEDLFLFLSTEITAGKSYLDVLDQVQSRIESIVSNLIEKDEILSKTGIDLNILLTLREDLYFYLYLFGNGEAILLREDKLISLTDLLKERSKTSYSKMGSMQLKVEDRIILSLGSYGSTDLLRDCLSELSFEKLSDDVSYCTLIIANENDSWPDNFEDYKSQQSEERENNNLKEEKSAVLKTSQIKGNKFPEILKTFGISLGNWIKNMSSPKSRSSLINSGSIPQTSSDEKDIKNHELISMSNKSEPLEPVECTDPGNPEDFESPRVGLILEKVKSFAFFLVQKSLKIKSDLIKSKIFISLKSAIFRMLTFLKQFFLVNFVGTVYFDKFDRRRILSRQSRNLTRNRLILVVIIFALLIFVNNSIQQAEQQRKELERIEKLTSQLRTFQNRLQSVKSQIIFGPEISPNRRVAINTELRSLETNIKNTPQISEINKLEYDKLLADLQSTFDEVNQIQGLKNVNVISDISLYYADANPSSMTISGQSIFVSDENRSVIYRLPISGLGLAPQVFVTGLVKPYLLLTDPEGNVVFFDNDVMASVGRFSSTQESVLTRFQGLTLSSVGRPKSASIFKGNGAIYEIRPNNKQVFKRDKLSSTFVSGGAVPTNDSTNWLTDNRLSSAVEIKTPYTVYVLTQSDGLLRFLSGKDTNLDFEKFQNMSREDFNSIKNCSSFDVTDKYLVFADNTQSRLMILEKIGDEINFQGYRFLKSIQYRGNLNLMRNMKKVLIDNSTNSVIVLDGSKILQVSM